MAQRPPNCMFRVDWAPNLAFGGRRMVAVLALALAALAWGAGSAAAASADYEEGSTSVWRRGGTACRWSRWTRPSGIQTSVNVPDGRGRGPVNRFSHVRVLADDSARDVVAPNNDTPYSIAWLDLRRQPMVIHIPRVNRYFVIPLYDPYTEDFRNLGSVPKTEPGDYVITGPGQHRMRIPKGTRRIKSRYDRVWIIGRTQSLRPGRPSEGEEDPGSLPDRPAEPLRNALQAAETQASRHQGR